MKLIDEAGAATTYTYDAASRPISRRLPNGVVTTQEYDGLDRLSARRFKGLHDGLQTVAGALSIVFGLWYAYQMVIAKGLLH